MASAVVILLCLTVGLILAIPIARQYPAALSMPDQLAGQPRLDAPIMQPLVQQISDDLKQATGGNRTIAGLYGHRDDAEHVFMIAGTTALVLDPNGELADAMTTGRLRKATSAGFTVEKGQDVDPGPLGGSMRCAPGTFYNELPISVCGWADHAATSRDSARASTAPHGGARGAWSGQFTTEREAVALVAERPGGLRFHGWSPTGYR